ncbi:MAG: EAL domain-containing protein [Hyphomicrobiaceae bacterium]
MLDFLRRTIAGRLYLVGGLALVAVIALGAAAVYFAGNTGRAARILYGGSLISAVEAGEIELLLERHRRLIEAAPLEFDRRQIVRDRENAEHVIGRIGELVSRSDPAFSARVKPVLKPIDALGREVLHLAENFAQDSALNIVEQYIAKAAELQRLVRAHRGDSVAHAELEARLLVRSANRLVNSVVGIGLVAALLIGPLAMFLLRGLIVKLRSISAAMLRLAENETDITLNVRHTPDEIGAMAGAVEIFRANAVQLLDHKSQLEQLNQWLDIAFNNMARGLSLYDSDERLVVCNAAYAAIYRLPPELTRPGVPFAAVLEHRWSRLGDVVPPLLKDANLRRELLAGDKKKTEELRFEQTMADGRVVEVALRPLERGGWVAIHEDVTERHEAGRRIERMAREDSLTRLANRFRFREVLDGLTRECGRRFALLAIDLDRFKEVNDTHGHPIGDQLLVEVAQRLSKAVRKSDLVARLGGDEFAVVLEEDIERPAVTVIATRIVAALHAPFQIEGHRIEIGGTVGVALAPEDGADTESLMKHADIALYRAKGEKRGTLVFFDAEMEDRLRKRRQLEQDLQGAVAQGELELHYQPIVSLADERVTGCEALIRWRHPVLGMISPAQFIPIAEETGLIVEIGAWALVQACREAVAWPDSMRVAVNLSVAQFSGPDLAEIAGDALMASGLAPERLELEVTESLLLGDDNATLALLHRLRALGLSIALDDFGTGYSSLSHLRSFPFDKLKIDQSFVRDLTQRAACEAIVGAVSRLAESLNMRTVAEGVETDEHLSRVRAAGCHEVQGYLFSRPVPASDLMAAVAAINARVAKSADAAA